MLGKYWRYYLVLLKYDDVVFPFFIFIVNPTMNLTSDIYCEYDRRKHQITILLRIPNIYSKIE